MTASRRSFDEWIGRERVTEDTLTLERARKLAATLDLDPERFAEGDPLPGGWHWIYHRRAVRRSGLADDGHERRGDFLPPMSLDRRMWAGGRLRMLRPLRIGSEVRRVSTIRSIEEKEGRSGRLAFVTVEHLLHDGHGVALEEEQDLVYLDRGPGRAASAADAPEPDWSERFVADEVTLFRFSALTFNGHRIHYDRSYATEVEGYPDLVVHGPLLALLLLGAGVRWAGVDGGQGVAGSGADSPRGAGPHADAPVIRFRYRAHQPVFCNEEIDLCGRVAREEGRSPADGSSGDERGSAGGRTGGPLELWAAHVARGVTMRAELVVER